MSIIRRTIFSIQMTYKPLLYPFIFIYVFFHCDCHQTQQYYSDMYLTNVLYNNSFDYIHEI